MEIANHNGMKVCNHNGTIKVAYNSFYWIEQISEGQWGNIISRLGMYLDTSDKKYHCYQCESYIKKYNIQEKVKDQLLLQNKNLHTSLRKIDEEIRCQNIEIVQLEKKEHLQDQEIIDLKNRVNILTLSKQELSNHHHQLSENFVDINSKLQKVELELSNLTKENEIENERYQNSFEDLNLRIECLW